jgi:hypothetical protein
VLEIFRFTVRARQSLAIMVLELEVLWTIFGFLEVRHLFGTEPLVLGRLPI